MRRAIAAAAAAALLVVPASAQAATVQAGDSCYAEGDEIGIEGTGFTPDGNVSLTLERANGTVLERTDDPTAGPEGDVSGGYRVKDETGWFTGSQTRFEMTARLVDQTDASITASTSFIFSRWNVGVRAAGGKIHPTRSAGIYAVGFTTAVNRRLYAHWLRNGKRVHRMRLGMLRAPCGDLRVRLSRGFPFRPVLPGRYEVRFSPSRTNVRTSTVRHTAVRVTRRIP